MLLVSTWIYFLQEMDLFSAGMNNVRDFTLIRDYIPFFTCQEENSSLAVVPSFNEVRMIVFSMDSASAPGPNGFTCYIF